MPAQPLKSVAAYSHFVAQLLDRTSVRTCTVTVWPASPYTGVAEGEVLFAGGIRLRIREELDFDAGLITSYGYEVSQAEGRLYWYDDHPHPNDTTLAPTLPHHKHIPPDIKHHRVPAPEMGFASPNLPVLVQEIEELTKRELS